MLLINGQKILIYMEMKFEVKVGGWEKLVIFFDFYFIVFFYC